MNLINIILAAFILCVGFLPPTWVSADSIANSPHDLSAGSTARIKSSEPRICIFCHTPHHSTVLSDPYYPGALWNRDENVQQYQPYQSSTLTAKPGQPQGPSRLCLSCHDGTIALGATAAHGTTAALGSLNTIYQTNPPPSPKKSAILGTDLRVDHPVSMQYGLKAGEFNDPINVTKTPVKLVARGSTLYVECTSCHNPHDNKFGNFLVVNTAIQSDALCTICHAKSGWTGSSHQTGGTRYPTVSAAVAKNGCVNCHTPHGAQQGENLLALSATGAGMDTNCYTSCHNSNNGAPYVDIYTQFNTPGRYTHPLALDAGTNKHTETEQLPLATVNKHVHCVDCHNPHQAVWQNAPLNWANAPAVDGVIQGVRGIDINGNPTTGAAQYEYQICYRCHSGDYALNGDYNDRTLQVSRIFTSMNERDRFDSSTAKSLHPVTQQSTGSGESLINTSMRSIYCNDCHDSHGAAYPHMLRQANPDIFSPTQTTSYPLCYSCHDVNFLLTNDPDQNRLKLHKAHVLGLHNPLSTNNSYRAPCAACHDPHGVPYKAGLTTATNSLHLVNFDLRWVGSTSSYDSSAKSCFISGAGTSGLNCHPTTTGTASYNPYPYNP